MKKYACQILTLVILTLAGCSEDKVSEIVIPAGSVDALAKAIENAETGGTIRLAAGVHNESGTLTINKQICLVGDDGAVLIVDTKPTVTAGEPIDPAIHIYQAPGACIDNIELRPVDPVGGSGIVFEQSDGASVRNCEIYKHQYSVVVEGSHETIIENNIIDPDGWQGVIGWAHGVLVVNGNETTILGNTLKNAVFGAWIGSMDGEVANNVITDNYIGVIPCAIPDSSAVMPRSNVAYTMISGFHWNIHDNTVENNFIGILLYDGAKECIVKNNDCKNNARIDIELGKYHAPNESGLGVPFPLAVTQYNKVDVGSYPNVRVRDCGGSNVVLGTAAIKDGDCF